MLESYFQRNVQYALLCSVRFNLFTIDNFDYAAPPNKSLFEGIALRPQHYDIEMPQKGVRSDMVYTIYADYLSYTILTPEVIRSTTLLEVTIIKFVHQTPDERLHYSVRNAKNSSVVYVNKENSFTLEHCYRHNNRIPFLKRLIKKIRCHTDNLCSGIPYSGVAIHLEIEMVI